MATDSDNRLPSERARHILRALVEQYIRDGQPVGSRTLSRSTGLDLSPATIRNVMADLEELGFIAAPHTSAGRVPTAKGYRFFVDTLVRLQPPPDAEVARIQSTLGERARGDAKAIAAAASSTLSAVTSLAGELVGVIDGLEMGLAILRLLDRSVAAEGVQIFIGEESGYRILDECSIVTAPYRVDGQIVGVLGVIGPTRMAYERVIPIVDVTARLVSSALNSGS